MRAYVAAALVAAAAAQVNTTATVYLTNGQWSIKFGVLDRSAGVAWATYTDESVTGSGFGSLSVATSASYNTTAQMYAAGYAEGALTQARIHQHYDNMHAWLLSNFPGESGIPQVYVEFFQTQDAWARAQVAANGSSPIWRGMGGILAQFDGLMAGYAAVAPANETLDTFAFQQLNSNGDFLDLIPALQPNSPYAWDWWNMTAEQVMDRVQRTTHCSGLTKILGNYSDIFFGHSAWFTYQATHRIYKHYNLPIQMAEAKGIAQSFSSYPGYLSSLDDFYNVWSTGLVVIETSNSIFNTSLYKQIQPQTLFAWQRVRLANLLATDPPSWSAVFSSYNSGTYNNAYGVLSIANWKPGSPLTPDMMWIVEQIPGLVVGGDVTEQLARGYIPQYNVPYWPQIYQISGYQAMIDKHARAGQPLSAQPIAGISYQLAPRAQIFRRDQGNVVDFDSFLNIMRYNDYKNDPYSKGSPWNAICSRGDLAGSPDGCYDTKASSVSLWGSHAAFAINGPTTNGGQLPPFSWSQFPDVPHEGLPPVYNFDFQVQQPAW